MSSSSSPSLQCVLDVHASLAEGPVWSLVERVLYWIDINAPSLNRFDPATGRNTVIKLPEPIGCFALKRSGGFIAALRSGMWLLDRDGALQTKIADAPYDPATHRYNDGRCDPQGRFWSGSMRQKQDAATGSLDRLGYDGRISQIVHGLTISNGLAWSPEGRTMYHADTPTQTVHAYDFDPATASISNARVFVKFSAPDDRPDGAAVDSEGCYWIALYNAGAVARIAPDGRTVARHALAARCPTMCAFGGDDLKTLYVTTASQQRSADELRQFPQSGGIFAMKVDVPGLPEPFYAG